MLLFVNMPLQPPLALTVPNQVLNAALMATCVCSGACVALVGQVSTTFGAAATVKVAWQVVVKGAQELV